MNNNDLTPIWQNVVQQNKFNTKIGFFALAAGACLYFHHREIKRLSREIEKLKERE